MLTLAWSVVSFIICAWTSRSFFDIAYADEVGQRLIIPVISGFCFAFLLIDFTVVPLGNFLTNALPQKGEPIHFFTVWIIKVLVFFVLAVAPMSVGSALGIRKRKAALPRSRGKSHLEHPNSSEGNE